MENVENILASIPGYASELGFNLHDPADHFKWFLASFLFAKRISVEIAKKTIQCFIDEGLVAPERLIKAGWHKVVDVLDRGGYTRYDYSTASNLLLLSETLLKKYGDLDTLHEQADSPQNLEKKLMEFKGVGPVCVNIFLRELKGIWLKAKTAPSPIAVKTASLLNVGDVDKYEASLVKIYLEFCKRRKCASCPVNTYCKNFIK